MGRHVQPSTGRRNAAFCTLAMCAAALGTGSAFAQGDPTIPPRVRTDSCLTSGCHSSIVTHRVTHGPAAQQKCDVCHTYENESEHIFLLTDDLNTLCTNCHILDDRTFKHAPVRDGACVSCHDPHGSEHVMMLRDDPAQGLCFRCHDLGTDNDKKFVHGPVAAGACVLCHDAHSSWYDHLLVEEQPNLCLGCHTEMETQRGRTAYHHAPVEQDCSACHDPHASDHAKQLNATAPDLCFRCHADVQESLAHANTVHGALTMENGCLGCHSPHYSSAAALQRQEQPALCLNCHDKPIETDSGRTLANMKVLLEENPDHHGPIREGQCNACHNPHTSEQDLLLVREYPPEFYAPYEEDRYALCFECHIADMAKTESGTGLTGFRDGDKNLHYLHVNREKGRTCRACHEVHASRNPFHIRDSVPFGKRGWELQIRYSKTENGGSCAPGCHVERSYAR